jgi:hypothetical protein
MFIFNYIEDWQINKFVLLECVILRRVCLGCNLKFMQLLRLSLSTYTWSSNVSKDTSGSLRANSISFFTKIYCSSSIFYFSIKIHRIILVWSACSLIQCSSLSWLDPSAYDIIRLPILFYRSFLGRTSNDRDIYSTWIRWTMDRLQLSIF